MSLRLRSFGIKALFCGALISSIVLLTATLFWIRSHFRSDSHSFWDRHSWKYLIYSADGVLEYSEFPSRGAEHGDRRMRFIAIRYRTIVLYSALLPITCIAYSIRNRVICNRRQRRIDANLCVQCGYDLRASVEICPECGSAFARLN